MSLTDEVKQQIKDWYDQEKAAAAKQNAFGGLYQQAVQKPWNTANITGAVQIGTATIWPQPTTVSIQPPPRDLRIDYLEERVDELSQQVARSDSDRARAIAMERTAAMKVITLHRLEDFLRNSHPDVLAEFDTVQSAVRRLTT